MQERSLLFLIVGIGFGGARALPSNDIVSWSSSKSFPSMPKEARVQPYGGSSCHLSTIGSLNSCCSKANIALPNIPANFRQVQLCERCDGMPGQ
eukprot:3149404-Amphidinium_carterae.1